ncbi:hypothetical protein LP7551_02868 [Roseibium album]|jgi:uncharacterized protein DUF6898|nr:hypothetical protein LP7551_02868 [Roseibium album]
MSRDPQPGEIYLEFRPLGQQVKVTAIDAATGVEVSAFGPKTAAQGDLKRIAVRKLQRRLAREAAATASSSDTNLY